MESNPLEELIPPLPREEFVKCNADSSLGRLSLKIAILGATSHIAKNLIANLATDSGLYLFARSVSRCRDFVKTELPHQLEDIKLLDIESFSQFDVHADLLINCVGFGTPEKLRKAGVEIFQVSEKYDNISLSYISNHKIPYVSFSSGAVYGPDISGKIDDRAEFRICLSSIEPNDAYRISKLNSEAKHRAAEGLAIFDLRVFGFFSRFIDMTSNYLASEMLRAIREKTEFLTDKEDIIRDYVHPFDLTDLVRRCAKASVPGGAFDVYSRHPVSKSQMIDEFQRHMGLRVRYVPSVRNTSMTGKKRYYASGNYRAGKLLGYNPRYSAIEALLSESEYILGKRLDCASFIPAE